MAQRKVFNGYHLQRFFFIPSRMQYNFQQGETVVLQPRYSGVYDKQREDIRCLFVVLSSRFVRACFS